MIANAITYGLGLQILPITLLIVGAVLLGHIWVHSKAGEETKVSEKIDSMQAHQDTVQPEMHVRTQNPEQPCEVTPCTAIHIVEGHLQESEPQNHKHIKPAAQTKHLSGRRSAHLLQH